MTTTMARHSLFSKHHLSRAQANKFSRTCDVFNRGYGGYNSRWCARDDVLEHAFGASETHPGKIYLSTVMLGTNDAMRLTNADAEARNVVKVELDEYETNMYKILKTAAERSELVMAMTPPVVDAKQRRKCQIGRYGKSWVGGPWEDARPSLGKYAAVVKKVVKRLDSEGYTWVYGCDIHSVTLAMQKEGLEVFCDGVHFSERGQDAVAENVTSMIEMFLSKKEQTWDPEFLLPDFPYGHEIRDPKDKGDAPEKIFDDYDAFRAKADVERTAIVAARLAGGRMQSGA